MLVAGESSGDALAAELVQALRLAIARTPVAPSADAQPLRAPMAAEFFGAGGPRLAEAGVELVCDLTQHAVVGLVEVVKHFPRFKKIFDRLLRTAIERTPDAIVLVDFAGFNRRFATAIRNYQRSREQSFNNWNPRLIQYVSPQVWASREGRADQLARDLDLLLSIFPFEKDWYANRVPDLPVEFVGNPILDRYPTFTPKPPERSPNQPLLLFLPGSREGELKRHLPVLLPAAGIIRATQPLPMRMVLPSERLLRMTLSEHVLPPDLQVQTGGLPESLSEATAAIASTGTVTVECAYFGVPTVAIYRTSWSTFQVAKRVVRVKHAAMPNILAGHTLFPELIQSQATPRNIARHALELINDQERRAFIQTGLSEVIRSLGTPGASHRAAQAIVQLLANPGRNGSHLRRTETVEV